MNTLKDHIFIFDHDGTLANTNRRDRPLFPYIKDLLKLLNDRGVPLYVWTARDRASTAKILQQNQVYQYFEYLCCQEDGFKPDTSGIREVLGQSKSRVMIGDSNADMVGGRELGAFCIGVDWTSGHESVKLELEKNGAHLVFNDSNELLNYIKENLGEINV